MDDHTQTPEGAAQVYAQGERLGSILTPYATAQRDALFGKPPGSPYARMVHYTTAEAALSIVRTKRLWLRNTNCMADYREVQHGLDILHKYFAKPSREKAFVDSLDSCAPGAASEAIRWFNTSWNDIRFNTYISSLSVHKDSEDKHGRLSMWRAFGGSASVRVALVIRVPAVSQGSRALGLIFSPVVYLTEASVHESLDEVIENIRSNGDFLRTVDRSLIVRSVFGMLVSVVVCLKHQGFHEEQEWRAIYAPKVWSSDLMESSTEVIAGVPQRVHKIPLDSRASAQLADLDFARLFDRLIIGPTPYSWPMYDAFVEALLSAGVPEAGIKIVASDIPIRV